MFGALALPTPARGQGSPAARILGQHRARISLPNDAPDLVLLEPRLKGDTLEFAREAPGAWTLDTATGRHQILLTEITRLQLQHSAWDRGALIGFLVGAGAIEAANGAGRFQVDRGETLFIGLLGGTGGALLGGLLGALFDRWETVYERR